MTKEDRDKKFLENEKLIWFAINSGHYGGLAEKEDLYQEGCLALINAVEKYDESLGEFSTYAVKAIKRSLSRYVSENIHSIRIPEGAVKETYKMDLYLKDHPDATLRELEKEFGEGSIWRYQDAKRIKVISGDQFVNEEEEESILFDFIEDKNSEVENHVIKNITAKKVREFFQKQDLGDKEKQKLAEQIIFEDKRCGLSKSEVGKIKKWYIARLQTRKIMKAFISEMGIPYGTRRWEIEEKLFGPDLER